PPPPPPPRRRAPLDEPGERARDAGGDVLGGGRLHRGHHRVVLEQHRVGVGAAHVDADASSHANTERKSRSYPKARGPTCSIPFGVRRIGGAGSAMTVTRCP